ncbi:MAG: hypothetical protein FJ128_14820 [Deltaproteobacteria bacterium]|nr:hypothetical protein [Deltaproteobacteria bacterium]
MKKHYLIRSAALAMVLGGLFLMGCAESRELYAGTYHSVEPFAGKGHIELVLKENGEATWKLAEEEKTIKFKWKVDGQRLWLYTKEGAIILAIPSEGGKVISLDMSGEWNPGCPPDKCITFKRVKEGG